MESHCHHPHHGHIQGSVQRLRWVLLLTLSFMFVEFIGGYYTRSLALTSDAAHMLTDAGALALSLFAFFMSSRPATDSRTYGYYRMEILAAFFNGLILILISIGIMVSAYFRYETPVQIKTVEMFWISTVGLIFNLVGAYFLTHGSHHQNLNIRGALFHVLGDALGSLGAMIAALLTHFYGWHEADPLVSVVIALIIVVSSFRLLSDAVHVILEGAPHHLDTEEIRRAIGKITEVKEVHDLHVWSITSGMVSLSVHVVAEEGSRHQILCAIRGMLVDRFHIEHVTIQIEDESLRHTEPSI